MVRDFTRWPLGRKATLALALGFVLIILTAVVLAAFPVALLKGMAEREISSRLEAPVKLGSLSREGYFSFTPEIVVHDVRIGQPAWAGKGDFLKADRINAHIPIWSLLTGDVQPRSLRVSGLELALVRDAQGNSNWAGRASKNDTAGDPVRLDRLVIEDSRFTLRDAKRRLNLTGTISANTSRGLAVEATGSFNGVPARASADGGRLTGNTGADWPFTAKLASSLLDLTARGTMKGALNFPQTRMTMHARGTSLKQLDYVIEAGLFGTQDIDLDGDVRHEGKDWHIDRLDGTIGRSRIHAKATVLKLDGRTKIDASIDAPQFDFDDLADDAGLAAARAKAARIGKRVIPDTRIDLSRMGPTDGVIRFKADRLLVEGGSVFRSLKGVLRLDHRILKLEDAVATLDAGQVTGWVKVDSTKRVPIFSTELSVKGTSLETLIGQPDMIRGPVEGLVRISGPGTTILEAFSHGNGKIAFVADRGAINRGAAYVLGQDLGGAMGQALGDGDAMVPLRCAVLAFGASGGKLKPAPLVLVTDISQSRGEGLIDLDGETIALSFRGISDGKPLLKLVDPLRVGGTLSDPAIKFVARSEKGSGSKNGILGAVGRSIGSALGLRKNEGSGNTGPLAAPGDCAPLKKEALS